jgi:hypothetical protein
MNKESETNQDRDIGMNNAPMKQHQHHPQHLHKAERHMNDMADLEKKERPTRGWGKNDVTF